ncbi:thermonuclease family protein [Oculatella sp. FACHB-28]|uniref:thermonuclease family protein n=1 Tax=Oculatella sp. FACHB-28 TaxID=2692845 RepID=UPI0016836EC2|nr:thermonuclease family protein [Oculatella sp. FACHB-28]MBD2054654.1 thermonuclease family protein [Oculatella sp. FACHB-28]
MKPIKWALVLLSISAIATSLGVGWQFWRQSQGIDTEYWQAEEVIDGDTFTVQQGQTAETIRLCGIDAPESEQPLGAKAEALVRGLVEGEEVGIVPVERDRYGHQVAEVFVSGGGEEETFVQQELLMAGLAYVYPEYVEGCPNGESMRMAEAIAQENKVGVWSGNHQRPWEYRQAQRE